jgi:hypothetical protein
MTKHTKTSGERQDAKDKFIDWLERMTGSGRVVFDYPCRLVKDWKAPVKPRRGDVLVEQLLLLDKAGELKARGLRWLLAQIPHHYYGFRGNPLTYVYVYLWRGNKQLPFDDWNECYVPLDPGRWLKQYRKWRRIA